MRREPGGLTSMGVVHRSRIASAPGLAARIEQHIQTRRLSSGNHLSAQNLADLFGASRTPVTQALRLLASRGLVRHETNRGFFVGDPASFGSAEPPHDPVEAAYRALARDRLAGVLPEEVNESELRVRYELTKAQLNLLLNRVIQEGWIERRAGYGWAFTEMLTTSQALAETFRLRRVLEPASLLEPGYRLDPRLAAECRQTEQAMLQGSLATMSLEALFDRGARFHEAVVAGSHNRYFLDTIRRINRIRRLLCYEAMDARSRYVQQCEEHLALLDLIERGRNEDAAEALRLHLEGVQQLYDRELRERPQAAERKG